MKYRGKIRKHIFRSEKFKKKLNNIFSNRKTQEKNFFFSKRKTQEKKYFGSKKPYKNSEKNFWVAKTN